MINQLIDRSSVATIKDNKSCVKTKFILSRSIGKTLIIAYKEQTEILESSLNQQGLNCEVLRQKHQPEYRDYSPSYLCLLNHKKAWELAAQQEKPTLIVEADFVPVRNIGQLPLPFNPMQKNVGMAWLYTCAPQVYSVSAEGYAEGFSVSTVAYIITPAAAQCLLELEAKIRENPGPQAYSSWDSTLDEFLRQRNFQNYIPFRNYGEHGGKPNLEHYKNGLSKTHRSDVLYGELAFIPLYIERIENHRLTLILERLQARLKGIARLVLGKYLRRATLKKSNFPLRLLYFSISRQMTFIV